jgi:hypothetical protein
LLKGIQVPGLTVEGAFFRTRNEVSQASKGDQVPWMSSFVLGDVYISPPAQAAQTAQPPSPQQQPSRPDPCAAAESHWKSTEAMGTKIAYADHLARFPSCPFATLAQAKIDALEQQAAAAAAAPPPASASVPAAAPSPSPQVASVTAQDTPVSLRAIEKCIDVGLRHAGARSGANCDGRAIRACRDQAGPERREIRAHDGVFS